MSAAGGARPPGDVGLESGKMLRTFAGQRDVILHIAFSPMAGESFPSVATATSALGCGNGQELRRLKSHTPFVLVATFSSDGKQILTGHTDNSVQVWAAPEMTDGLTDGEEGAVRSPDVPLRRHPTTKRCPGAPNGTRTSPSASNHEHARREPSWVDADTSLWD
jgi:WD40 repeat protein